MHEGPPTNQSIESEKERAIMEIIALARELNESKESHPFPGIDAVSYEKLKTDEAEFPGFATPIDELIERFKNEGMKVVLGEHPESGNIFILPAQSNDIENDSIFPKHLQIADSMHEKLRRLILLKRG